MTAMTTNLFLLPNKVPNTADEWEKIAADYFSRWNFPNCIGALDGKHIAMRCPRNSSSMNFNYKHTFSIVLMALADANYKLIYVDVGCKGRISDGGVFNRSSLYSAIERNSLNIPPPKCLPGSVVETPYVIVADDAFALKTYLMKPYAFRSQDIGQRVFNYRLSRARRMVESVFGLMASKFRILRSTIELSEENVTTCVLAICALHNFLLASDRATYTQSFNRNSGVDQDTQIDPESRPANGERNASNEAKNLREKLKDYFVSDGEVSWQNEMI